MKKIALGQEVSDFDFTEVHERTVVDYDTELGEQPVAMYLGDVPVMTYGDYSCISGPPKTMKTVYKNGLIANYIGGKAQNRFDIGRGVDSSKKYVLDLDTEQSKWHVKRNVDQIRRMIGVKHEFYKSFNLRLESKETRFKFLKHLIHDSQYSGQIGLICLDGAADLIPSINDEAASYALAEELGHLAIQGDCHILTVIHMNSTGKVTGHVGSAVMKKSETIFGLKKSGSDYIKVTPSFCRNKNFTEFEFTVDDKFLPYVKGQDGDDLFSDNEDTAF